MASRATSKGIVPVIRTSDADFEASFFKMIERRHQEAEDIEKAVRKILNRVRDGGDEELLACVRKFDGAKIESIEDLEVTNDERDAAAEQIDGADRAAPLAHPALWWQNRRSNPGESTSGAIVRATARLFSNGLHLLWWGRR